MAGKYSTAHLREKPDSAMRQLASHYYIRSRRAEDENDRLQAALRKSTEVQQRMANQLADMQDLARAMLGEPEL